MLKSEILYSAWLEAVNNHDFQVAEELYEKLIKLNPNTPGINFPMGVWYKEKGLWDKAKAAFMRALDTDPEIYADTYYYLGNVVREQKDYSLAATYYQKSLKVNPEFFEVRYNLGKIYALQGQSKKALLHFRKAQELNPLDLDTNINIGVELSNQGYREEALEAYRKALEIDPYSYLVHSNIGVEYTLLKDFKNAIDYHKKALALNFFYADGWYNLACTYARANDLENSCKALERSIRLDAENIEYAKKDPELENIRNTLHFQDLVKPRQ